MSFPRYPVYKNSGVEWLGEVPEHWGVGPLGYLCSKIGSGKTPSGGAEAYCDEGIVFIRSQNVYDEGLFLDDVAYIDTKTDEDLRASRVQVGDILLNITGASLGRTCMVPDGFPSANVNQHVCILRLQDAANRQFVARFMQGLSAKSYIDNAQTGAAREGLNFAQISKLKLAVPPLPEQHAIATFLDRETSKIDALIAEQRRLIDLLKEKRQAVISHAVTKGLNPDAKMKDSGVEWLGEVPEHWIASRLSYLTEKIVDGAHFTPTYVETGVPFLRVTDITAPSIDLDDVKRIPISEHEELVKRCKPERGDLLLSKNGTIGVPRVVDWDWDFSIFVSLCLIKLQSKLDAYFASYVFLSSAIALQINDACKQSTVTNLHLEKISGFRFAVPPLDEQNAIVAYLNVETSRLDLLTSEAQRAIDLLQERRTALISAAVTGQIDVRNVTA